MVVKKKRDPQSVLVSVRISKELDELLSKRMDSLCKERPGEVINKSDAVRIIFARALMGHD